MLASLCRHDGSACAAVVVNSCHPGGQPISPWWRARAAMVAQLVPQWWSTRTTMVASLCRHDGSACAAVVVNSYHPGGQPISPWWRARAAMVAQLVPQWWLTRTTMVASLCRHDGSACAAVVVNSYHHGGELVPP